MRYLTLFCFLFVIYSCQGEFSNDVFTREICKSNSCDRFAYCDDSSGKIKCTCGQGYTGDGELCTEIDGCKINPCFPGVECADDPPPSTGRTCGLCPENYDGDGQTCTNINECVRKTAGCPANSMCRDLPDGYECICEAGYEEQDGKCLDIDGCRDNPCANGVKCYDLAPPQTGAICGPCPSGFVGDGKECAYANECKLGWFHCPANSHCNDEPPPLQYSCVCDEGYKRSSDECLGQDGCKTETCYDINGCANAPCFRGVICTDLKPPNRGYQCGTCPSGYTGDGKECEDIDECQLDDDHVCPLHSTCVNRAPPLEYECICDSGFAGPNCEIPTGCEGVITFEDPELESVVRRSIAGVLGISEYDGEIRFENLEGITELIGPPNRIEELTGINCFVNLTKIDLSEGAIHNGSTVSWTGLDKLEELNISYNKGLTSLVTKPSSGFHLGGLKNLQRLNISNNRLVDLAHASWEDFPALTDLTVEKSILAQVSGELPDGVVSLAVPDSIERLRVYFDNLQLDKLDCQNAHHLKRLDISVRDSLSGLLQADWSRFENLKELILGWYESRRFILIRPTMAIANDGSTPDITERKLWGGLEKLELLKLVNAEIKSWYGYTWTELSNLKELVFDNVGIRHLQGVHWDTMTRLETLTIRGNAIDDADLEDILWERLTELRSLNLEKNLIANLNSVSWSHLQKLRNVDLSNNQIQNLRGVDWESLDGLVTLDLRNNNIEISVGDVDELQDSYFPSLHGLKIYLHGNATDCALLEWIVPGPGPGSGPEIDCTTEEW